LNRIIVLTYIVVVSVGTVLTTPMHYYNYINGQPLLVDITFRPIWRIGFETINGAAVLYDINYKLYYLLLLIVTAAAAGLFYIFKRREV